MAVVVTALLGASLFVVAAPGPALGAKAPLTCKTKKVDGKSFRFCKGVTIPKIKSADGTVLLDADVTLPGKSKKPLGLIVMLHGLGASKSSYELDLDGDTPEPIEGTGGKYHYNNYWFASKGFAVLNYTARGFHEDACLDDSVESTDGDLELYGPSPACAPQLDSIDHEIKDTQYLIGRLVDGTLLSDKSVEINPSRVGVTGGSYGGGHTWLLSRRNTFKSPKGTKIKIAAGVPIIGWTDLVNALMPNGKARDDFIPEPDVEQRAAETPGVLKASFIAGFYLSMKQASAEGELPDYIDTWKSRFDEGPPYDDPVSVDAMNKLLSKRSAYYVEKKGAFDTPLLVIQGFTDTIFPAVEAVRMYNRLTEDDPGYPISMYIGDLGHPIAQNKAAEVAYMNDMITKWFNYYLKNKGQEPAHEVEARTQDCYATGPGDVGSLYRGSSWEDVIGAPDEVINSPSSGELQVDVSDPHAGTLNPIQLEGVASCPTTDTAVAGGNVAIDSEPLTEAFEMLGLPQVAFDAVPSEGDMYVAMHLWDVDPETEMQILVTRGVYQLGGSGLPQDEVSTQLFGNGWTFPSGHVIRLELTANDAPTFLAPGSDTGTIDISNVMLSVPRPNGEPVATTALPARVLRKIGRVTVDF
ncbi:MAG: hypothetical protein JJE05_12125 [Actinobacteria bacterium]|nr:hypothetical protein [Actinomycetota bacterium]